MTDGMALSIILIGIFMIAIAKILSHGNYPEAFSLKAGQYVAGIDIPPGRGDLIATSGSGSFCVKPKKSKEWTIGNPIGGLHPDRFRNLALNRGDILEINGNVVIKIAPPEPIEDPKTDALCPGIYRFGVDVPAGKYDLEIVSGDGDVLLVEIGKDDYSFFQDMSASNPIKADSFANVTCARSNELWVNGSLEIKLKPSKRQPLLMRK